MKEQLEKRTKRFALDIIEEVDALGSGTVSWVLGKQLVKAGTSVGSNYREACRAESRADFIHKIGVVEKEAAESCLWLELLLESGRGSKERTPRLLDEARELLAISHGIRTHRKEPAYEMNPRAHASLNSQFAIRNSKFETVRNPQSAISG